MKIGIFGGTFNPIHFGHLRGAEEVRENLKLDKVIFIPSGIPPLKNNDIAESFHRYNMTVLATEDNPYFEVSDYEIKINRPSYSVNTLMHFKKLYESNTLLFIIGVDSFLELPRWHKPEKILKMVDIIVMSRPGYNNFENSEFIESQIGEGCYSLKNSDRKLYFLKISPFFYSSSDLRRLIRNGRSIRYLLPQKVYEYIEDNKLYRE